LLRSDPPSDPIATPIIHKSSARQGTEQACHSPFTSRCGRKRAADVLWMTGVSTTRLRNADQWLRTSFWNWETVDTSNTPFGSPHTCICGRDCTWPSSDRIHEKNSAVLDPEVDILESGGQIGWLVADQKACLVRPSAMDETFLES
jgi:hypothetical protein